MSIENTKCLEGFMRLCDDGWLQGWHERNGGNLSYRMTEDDVDSCKPFFDAQPGQWVQLPVQADNLKGEYFLVTGSGKYMRNVCFGADKTCAILEINDEGNAWRKVWGLVEGGSPTSEFPTHFMNHSIRKKVTDGVSRVIYHAHSPEIITLTTMVAPSSRDYTRILWKSMTECVLIFPEGVGVVPWMVPGGADIAHATCELMEKFAAVVWCQHGMFVTGATFDEAFSLMHTIEKSAYLYLNTRAALGGAEPTYQITDEQLVAVCDAFGVKPNMEFLDL